MKTGESRIATLLGGAAVEPQVMALALRLAPNLYCADGGANTAVDMGLEPLSVVGDMDSITPDTVAALTCPARASRIATEVPSSTAPGLHRRLKRPPARLAPIPSP